MGYEGNCMVPGCGVCGNPPASEEPSLQELVPDYTAEPAEDEFDAIVEHNLLLGSVNALCQIAATQMGVIQNLQIAATQMGVIQNLAAVPVYDSDRLDTYLRYLDNAMSALDDAVESFYADDDEDAEAV